MIRVLIPYHLRVLAKVDGEVTLDVPAPITLRSILDALERTYPVLAGTIREHPSGKRRPLIRFFACEDDWTFESPDAELPSAIATGTEPFWVVGAIAGG